MKAIAQNLISCHKVAWSKKLVTDTQVALKHLSYLKSTWSVLYSQGQNYHRIKSQSTSMNHETEGS